MSNTLGGENGRQTKKHMMHDTVRMQHIHGSYRDVAALARNFPVTADCVYRSPQHSEEGELCTL